MPPWLHDLGGGVHCIDTGFLRDRFDAAYLLVQDGHAAFIDTGTNHAVPRLLAALQHLGLPKSAVDFVIPTHVHLDHAGGCGLLMQSLPAARLIVHPRGARHLIDPSALYAGALAVYGAEEMARSYGELVPVAADRVLSSHDGMSLEAAGRTLQFADTPGHARHHHCIWDPVTQGWFTGDTFGASYREFDTPAGPWLIPVATPPQFEPEALRLSVQRLLAVGPACVYVTHFGRLDVLPERAAHMLGVLDDLVQLGHACRSQPDRHAALRQGVLDLLTASLRTHGCTLPADAVAALLEVDLELTAQGLGTWLDRQSTLAA